jgi:glycosyltransferase involved in cell wall biosynthesis
MVTDGRHKPLADRGTTSRPLAKIARKILLLAIDDDCVLSSCRPAIRVLTELAREVVIAAASGRMHEIEGLGGRVIAFDIRSIRSSLVQDSLWAWTFARILEDEDPDAVHLFGLKSVALACIAAKLVPARHVVLHLPNLGPLQAANAGLGWWHRRLLLKLMASLVSKPSSFLLVENSEDLTFLLDVGVVPGPRFAVLGGAGIDPDRYPLLGSTHNDIPVAAFVSALTASNGVGILMRAFDRIWAKGVRLRLELHGNRPDNETAVARADLDQWTLHPGVRILAPAADVRELWRRADIFVMPAQVRQGLPRTVLEAAASGRPLVVSDVLGARDFVRNGVEGFVVPSQDTAALGEALERLAGDAGLRVRMGEAARLRILQGFTEAHVKEALKNAYRSLLGVTMRAAASP